LSPNHNHIQYDEYGDEYNTTEQIYSNTVKQTAQSDCSLVKNAADSGHNDCTAVKQAAVEDSCARGDQQWDTVN